MEMKKLFKNKLALSTAVTSLILRVVSVLLASVASYFALNVAGTRVQQKRLYLSNVSVWYESSNSTLSSLIVTSTLRYRNHCESSLIWFTKTP